MRQEARQAHSWPHWPRLEHRDDPGAEPAGALQHPADRVLVDQQGPQRQVVVPVLSAGRAVRQSAGAGAR